MKSHTATKSISRLVLIAMIVAQCAAPPFAIARASHQFGPRPAPRALPVSLSVLGDFDGDQLPDHAEVHLAGPHRCIRVRFGNSRETHLELHATPQMPGALLARDANQDQKPDLTWVSFDQSKAAEVWLGDGRGNFARASEKNAGARALLSGDPDPGLAGDVNDERVFLTPCPVSSESARSEGFSDVIRDAPFIGCRNDRCDFGLYLFCLRERGPPLHTSFS